MVRLKLAVNSEDAWSRARILGHQGLVALAVVWLSTLWILAPRARGQQAAPSWQAEVRKYAEAQDWTAALSIVDREVARAPQDMDVRAWRARVLAWSGRLSEAAQEYTEILKAAPIDPDNWLGLANVYAREGRNQEALEDLSRAIALAPDRADLRAARGRALRDLGSRDEAREEFKRLWHSIPPVRKRGPACSPCAGSRGTNCVSARATTFSISRRRIMTAG